ncbi:MAG: dehydratase [Alphaproteobacteria bacterium]|nr:dehydratase [Alphaproteobacteria bacterium]
MTRWYEDIDVGSEFPLGEHTFTTGEIKRFAKSYDPQYFHLDGALAAQSQFGGLVASGWHTASMGHRKMVDTIMAEADQIRATGGVPGEAGPSPGIDKMDFLAPVRPDDTISYRLLVRAKRPSKSLPGWGVMTYFMDGTNQDGVTVYTQEFVAFNRIRRPNLTLGQRVGMFIAALPIVGPMIRTRRLR